MPRLLKNGTVSEYTIQKTLIQWCRLQPQLHSSTGRLLVMHIPNEGKRDPAYAFMTTVKGIRKGASDLFIPIARNGKYGMWLELKSRNGTVKPEQLEFLEDMAEQGYHTGICYDIDSAIMAIRLYVGI